MCTPCPKELYGVVLANDGTQPVSEAQITYGKHSLDFKTIVPGGSAGYGTVNLPITETASVFWKTESGAEFKTTVSLKDVINDRKQYDRDIWVRLHDDGTATVEVK